MKKFVCGFLILITIMLITGCSSYTSTSNNSISQSHNSMPTSAPTAYSTQRPTYKSTQKPTAKPASKTTNSSYSSSSFTNKYGTPTTKCAHPGCTNYIASSGDTNCCPSHSKRCFECGKYIDEDAFYCMDCIRKALGQ